MNAQILKYGFVLTFATQFFFLTNGLTNPAMTWKERRLALREMRRKQNLAEAEGLEGQTVREILEARRTGRLSRRQDRRGSRGWGFRKNAWIKRLQDHLEQLSRTTAAPAGSSNAPEAAFVASSHTGVSSGSKGSRGRDKNVISAHEPVDNGELSNVVHIHVHEGETGFRNDALPSLNNVDTTDESNVSTTTSDPSTHGNAISDDEHTADTGLFPVQPGFAIQDMPIIDLSALADPIDQIATLISSTKESEEKSGKSDDGSELSNAIDEGVVNSSDLNEPVTGGFVLGMVSLANTSVQTGEAVVDEGAVATSAIMNANTSNDSGNKSVKSDGGSEMNNVTDVSVIDTSDFNETLNDGAVLGAASIVDTSVRAEEQEEDEAENSSETKPDTSDFNETFNDGAVLGEASIVDTSVRAEEQEENEDENSSETKHESSINRDGTESTTDPAIPITNGHHPINNSLQLDEINENLIGERGVPAVLRDVNLNDFLPSELNEGTTTAGTVNKTEIKPAGIQLMNGEIMPMIETEKTRNRKRHRLALSFLAAGLLNRLKSGK